MALKFALFLKMAMLTLSIIPVCFGLNILIKSLISTGVHNAVIALIGVVMLAAYLALIVYLCKRDASQISNWHFYVFSLFAVTSIIDLGVGLEQDGYISEFISEYLKNGEPYLFSPFGRAICYFDGFGMYALYLYMIFAITNKKSYRSAGIYWAGTLCFSMIVLMSGILCGTFGLYPSSSLNVPYFILPFVIVWQLLRQKTPIETTTVSPSPLHRRPIDLLLVTLLIVNAFITLVKGVAVLGNNISFVHYHLEHIEPYLVMKEPSPFLLIQSLVCLFYFLPVYVLSVYGLIVPGCSWMKELTLFHAGAMAEGQYALMATALHPEIAGSSFGTKNPTVFWIVNLLIVLVPHLLLARYYSSKDYFRKSINEKQGKANKKPKHY